MIYSELAELLLFYAQREGDIAVTNKIDRYAEQARELISKTARLVVMEKNTTFLFTSSVFALPTDWLEFKSVRAQSGSRKYSLRELWRSNFDERTSEMTGDLFAYTIDGGNVEIGPYSESVELPVTYYARPTALVNPGDSNSVSDRYPNLYLFAMLFYQASSIQDKIQAQDWLNQYRTEVTAANDADRKARRSGDGLTL